MLSDPGIQFTSDVMKKIHKILSVKPFFTTPFHPARNGLSKKINGILKGIIKELCHDHPKEWHHYRYRKIQSSSLEFSLFELVYGQKPKGPIALLSDLWE